MKREVYPEEMRTEERRKTIFELLSKTSLQSKIAFGLVFLGIILNILFLLNVIANPESSSFWYNIKSVLVEYRPIDLMLKSKNPNMPQIPIYSYFYDFQASFHVGYWIMTASLVVGGSGVLAKNYFEARKQQQIFHMLNVGCFVIGFTKILINAVNLRNGYFGQAILLLFFLTIYPMVLVLPLQLLTHVKQKSIYEILPNKDDNRKAKVRNIVSMCLIGLFSILISVSYLGIDAVV